MDVENYSTKQEEETKSEFINDDFLGDLEILIDKERQDPSDKAIREYARYLGMNLEDDENLLYLAKEGLRSPIPAGWKTCKTTKQQIYYYNSRTGQT